MFVVGDPDQAIYGWRGANVVNMEKSFDLDYPGSLLDIVLLAQQGLLCNSQFLSISYLKGFISTVHQSPVLGM